MRRDILEDERSIHGTLRLGRPTLPLRAADFLCRCISDQVVDTLLMVVPGLFYLGAAVVITVAPFYLLILVVLAR